MEQIQLKASIRESRGKQQAKRMRDSGLVPAVVYHRGEEPVAIAIADKEISKIIRAHSGENILINLTIEKEKKARPRAVIIKEVQHHPVKRGILHVDFNEISLSEKITVDVEIIAVGEAPGVKQEGGVLEHPLREVKIQCLPMDIPKHIDVDVSALKLNDAIHVKDLKVSDKIKILTDGESLLFQVKLPVEEKVEEAAETVAAEPEVMREKKEEEGAEKPGTAKEEPKAAKEAPKAEKK